MPASIGRVTSLLAAYALLGLAARLAWAAPDIALDASLVTGLLVGVVGHRLWRRPLLRGADIPLYLLLGGAACIPLGYAHPLAGMGAAIVAACGLTVCLAGMTTVASRWAPRVIHACHLGVGVSAVVAMVLGWPPRNGLMLVGMSGSLALGLSVAWARSDAAIHAAMGAAASTESPRVEHT